MTVVSVNNLCHPIGDRISVKQINVPGGIDKSKHLKSSRWENFKRNLKYLTTCIKTLSMCSCDPGVIGQCLEALVLI